MDTDAELYYYTQIQEMEKALKLYIKPEAQTQEN